MATTRMAPVSDLIVEDSAEVGNLQIIPNLPPADNPPPGPNIGTYPAGDIFIQPGPGANLFINWDAGASHATVWGGTTPGEQVAIINDDGSAIFNGSVTVGADPTQPMQAATKQYVDRHSGGGGGGGTDVRYVVKPSGDTTGLTDGLNIQNALTEFGAVQLAAGDYYVGGNNTTIDVPQSCSLIGLGFNTVLWNCATTSDIFRIHYYITWPSPSWDCDRTDQAEFASFQIRQKPGIVPTGGYAFNIGSGYNYSGSGDLRFLTNLDIHNILMNRIYGGFYVQPSLLYLFVHNNIGNNFTGGGFLYNDTGYWSGDLHYTDNEMVGPPGTTGLTIASGEVLHFVGNKLNGAGILFSGVGKSQSVIFTNTSIEGPGTGYAIDFGTGIAPKCPQFIGLQAQGFDALIGHPTNVENGFTIMAYLNEALADYPKGLVTNMVGSNVWVPPLPTGGGTGPAPVYQEFAEMSGPVNTLLTAYSGRSGLGFVPFTGETSNPAITLVTPILNGFSSAVVASGQQGAGNYGDMLSTVIPASADYTVSMVFSQFGTVPGGGIIPNGGVFFRASNSAYTTYQLLSSISGTLVQFILYSVVNGAATMLGQSNILAQYLLGPHTLAISAKGTSILCTLDGNTFITATDGSITAAGQGGFRLAGNLMGTNFSIQ